MSVMFHTFSLATVGLAASGLATLLIGLGSAQVLGPATQTKSSSNQMASNQKPSIQTPLQTKPLGVNDIRRLAGQPPVSINPTFQAECTAHAQYLTLADRGEHREDPTSPHRSEAGERCAHGHYFVTTMTGAQRDRAIRYWASGPFHLPQLIDPRLKSLAFGEARDEKGSVLAAFVLDVKRGLTGKAAYPVLFPGPNVQSPLYTAAEYEWPDFTPSCTGYAHPMGAPIMRLSGPGVHLKTAALKINGKPKAACVLTELNFMGKNADETRIGRNVLKSQGAAALIPKVPLQPGDQVQVAFFTTQGKSAWRFSVK